MCLPTALRYPSPSVETAIKTAADSAEFFAHVAGVRASLVEMLTQGHTAHEMALFAKKAVTTWVQQNTDEFVGPYYVPQLRTEHIDEFSRRQRWDDILEARRDFFAQLLGRDDDKDALRPETGGGGC